MSETAASAETTSIIKIPIIPANNTRSAKHEVGAHVVYLPLETALTAHHRTDAHTAQYSAPSIGRRLNGDPAQWAGKVHMVIVAFDLDSKVAHSGGDPATDEWWQALKATCTAHWPNAILYRTRGGARLVFRLAQPVPMYSGKDEESWSRLYLASCAHLADKLGPLTETVTVDPVGDWDRLFRLPRATRDESDAPENLELIIPTTVEIWSPKLSDENKQVGETLRKKKKRSKANGHAKNKSNGKGATTHGLYYEMIAGYDGIRFEKDPGCFAVECPLSDEHSKGGDPSSDTSCVLWVPVEAHETRGVIKCLHSGSGHDQIYGDEWLGRGKFTAEAIAEAEAKLGIKTKSKKKSAKASDKRHPLTQGGNADRVVGCVGKDMRHSGAFGWMQWSDTHWEVDDAEAVAYSATWDVVRSIEKEAHDVTGDDDASEALRRAIRKHAHQSDNSRHLEGAMKMVANRLNVAGALFDCNPNLINFTNGTLDLTTGKLSTHRREDLLTRVCPVDYVPDATHPLWDKALRDFTGSDAEMTAHLAMMAGLALSGDTSRKVFFYLYGEGDTGKSTFLNALLSAFGPYGGAPSSESFIKLRDRTERRPDLVAIRAARLLVVPEMSDESKLDEGLLKAITGGDTIQIRDNQKAPFSWTPRCSIVFSSNHAPVAKVDSDAFWRRAQVIPFAHVIPAHERDTEFSTKLRSTEARAAIMAWAVRGYVALQAAGELPRPDRVRAATDAARGERDPFRDYFSELFFDPGVRVTRSALRSSYTAWCEASGERPLPQRRVLAALRSKGCDVSESVRVRDVRGNPVRGVSGVTLRTAGHNPAEFRDN